MAGKMKLAQYLRAVGVSASETEQKIRQLTGTHVTKSLLDDIMDETGRQRRHEKPPLVASAKAEALARWLSNEMGRPIQISVIDGLEVI